MATDNGKIAGIINWTFTGTLTRTHAYGARDPKSGRRWFSVALSYGRYDIQKWMNNSNDDILLRFTHVCWALRESWGEITFAPFISEFVVQRTKCSLSLNSCSPGTRIVSTTDDYMHCIDLHKRASNLWFILKTLKRICVDRFTSYQRFEVNALHCYSVQIRVWPATCVSKGSLSVHMY